MDQVRNIAKIIWTQRFWVLTALGTIIGTVCWNIASSNLDTEFKKRQGAIDSAYSTVNSISNEAVHPNDDVNAGDMKQAKHQRDLVLKVWKDLYEHQRAEVLHWPESLGKGFVKRMQGRKFGDRQISSQVRDRYRNYIETRFDALLEIVQAEKLTERGRSRAGGEFGGEFGGGGIAATGEEVEEEIFLVQWLDQTKLQQKLLFKSKPSAMQVWVTQEDLWVYETLLNVIANTNTARGASRPDNTAVRAIEILQVGSEASSPTTGRVFIPKPVAGAEGMGGGEFGGGEFGEYGGGEYGDEFGDEFAGGGEYGDEFGGGEFGEYGGSGMGGDAGLTVNRYLDAEGKPIEAATETFGTTEFRQLPIHMKLYMDQRWIPRVLIECANSALPIEVKQLRINASQSGTGFSGGRSGRTRRPSRGLKGIAPDANLAEVEIRGVVYIYNAPDTETLTVPGDEGNGSAAEESI